MTVENRNTGKKVDEYIKTGRMNPIHFGLIDRWMVFDFGNWNEKNPTNGSDRCFSSLGLAVTRQALRSKILVSEEKEKKTKNVLIWCVFGDAWAK